MKASPLFVTKVLDRIEFGLLSECWEWRGYKVTRGYGGITYKKKMLLAHRVVYALIADYPLDFPSEIVIRHRCDNPPCVNFTHLEHGTQLDNMQDLSQRRTKQTHCFRGHLKDPKRTACRDCQRMSQRVRSGHWLWDDDYMNVHININNPPKEYSRVVNGKVYSYP